VNIEIYFLGTSSGVPTVDRNVPSILIRRKGEHIFFDFGEGTQRQLFKLGLGFGKKMKIFISHLHGDHIFGLLPLMQTLTLFKRRDPVEIYGPIKLYSFIEYNMELLDIELTFEIVFKPIYHNTVLDFGDYIVKVIKNVHGGLSYSFRLDEKGRPGKFDVDKAIEEGIPKEFWSKLASGEDIVIGSKRYKYKNFVIPPPVKGRSIVYSGDTMPFPEFVDFAKDADVLIHEATFTSEMKERSIETMHTTALEAAKIARDANVKILVLTHFSARYNDLTEHLKEARRIFPATFIARDLDVLTIPYVSPHSKSG